MDNEVKLIMKHIDTDELVRSSDPVIRSATRYPWTNALARDCIQTYLLTVMIFHYKCVDLAYYCTWHNTAEDISIMRQC